jgi:DNA modification methylase
MNETNVQDPVVVIDPFFGTGAVGVAALRAGCYFIGVDNDPDCLV